MSVKHTARSDSFITLWAAEDSGYRGRVETAGRYPESRIRGHLEYYNQGCDSIVVPCDVVERLSTPVPKGFFDGDFGNWVKNNRNNWQVLIASAIENPKHQPKPVYRGAKRREYEDA
ncbi:hypothetical protein [Pantoea stewartii]|uniref:hypothetical protein n=1 Tax=Pantoea stewartii TaxID=66269 RepID=UPI0011309304|nr:hypothetical protein [Pantoea stewartii]KAB0551629.1 hypothetical protein F7Q90_16915 [Pantoea stewartii subsp. stewartii]